MVAARRLHRTLAVLLGVFILLHLVNHAAILWGADAHRAVLAALSPIYRHPMIELPLLAGFALQLGLGLRLAWRRG